MTTGTRTDRRGAAARGRGLRGRWAARRLFAAAKRGDRAALDAVSAIAATPSHRRSTQARRALARWIPALLSRDDPEARAYAEALCRDASGAMLAVLWRKDAGPGTPLRAVLLTNDHAPSQPVLDALWRECLRTADRPLLDVLVRWRRPASDGIQRSFSIVALGGNEDDAGQEHAEHLCDAAMDDPRMAWICREYGLAPAEPVKRAEFFLLTGQHGQYRALDPDGSLLTLAYASCSDSGRTRLGKAMLTAGELDLVRVVAGDRRGRLHAMSAEETRYLGQRLAERGEWEELWSLVQDLPLQTGTRLARLFDRWAPHDPDSRRIFELFRETNPKDVSSTVDRMKRWTEAAARTTTLQFDGGVTSLSFAPNGPYLAVANSDGTVGVVDLRTQELLQRHTGFTAPVALLTEDGALIVGEGDTRARSGRLVHCSAGGERTSHTCGPVTALTSAGEDGRFAAGTRDGHLLFASPDGGPAVIQHVRALGLERTDWPRAIAAHRASGLVAVLGRKLAVVPAAGPATVAEAGDRQPVAAGFIDADTLVYAEDDGTVVRLQGRQWRRTSWNPAFTVLGFRGLGIDSTARPVVLQKGGMLHFLNTKLDTEQVYLPPAKTDPTGLGVSPSGDFAAVSHRTGRVEILDLRIGELPGIISRPLHDLTPRHLSIVATALTHKRRLLLPEFTVTLRLLHACLEHRFRFDIEIGDAAPLAAGDYDISL